MDDPFPINLGSPTTLCLEPRFWLLHHAAITSRYPTIKHIVFLSDFSGEEIRSWSWGDSTCYGFKALRHTGYILFHDKAWYTMREVYCDLLKQVWPNLEFTLYEDPAKE